MLQSLAQGSPRPPNTQLWQLLLSTPRLHWGSIHSVCILQSQEHLPPHNRQPEGWGGWTPQPPQAQEDPSPASHQAAPSLAGQYITQQQYRRYWDTAAILVGAKPQPSTQVPWQSCDLLVLCRLAHLLRDCSADVALILSKDTLQSAYTSQFYISVLSPLDERMCLTGGGTVKFAPQVFHTANGMKITNHKCYIKLFPKRSTIKSKKFQTWNIGSLSFMKAGFESYAIHIKVMNIFL